MGSTYEYSEVCSEYSATSSEYSPPTDEVRNSRGRLLSLHLDAPIIDNLEVLDEVFRELLEHLAEEPTHEKQTYRAAEGSTEDLDDESGIC